MGMGEDDVSRGAEGAGENPGTLSGGTGGGNLFLKSKGKRFNSEKE